MKKICTICCLAISLVAASSAMAADSIQGRLGVTGRIGFLVPSDSEAFNFPTTKLETDVGFGPDD